MKRNRLEIQTAIEIDRRDDVPDLSQPTEPLREPKRCSYWRVGVKPLPFGAAPGVAAGVAGVTPVPFPV